MFGFSLFKLIVLAAIIAVVWYGFKYYSRIEAVRASEERLKGARRRAKHPEVEDAETMVQCPVCKVYQPAGDTAPCDRADCPY
jgi:hypothetical protein